MVDRKVSSKSEVGEVSRSYIAGASMRLAAGVMANHSFAAARHGDEILVDSGVVGEFGVECARQAVSLPDHYDLSRFQFMPAAWRRLKHP